MNQRLPYLIVLTLLAACSHTPPEVVTAPVRAEAPAPIVAPKQADEPPTKVAILVSSTIPAYREVAEIINARLGSRASLHYLQESQDKNLLSVGEITRSQHSQLVAIGLDAAISSKKLAKNQVVFCQVFNYEDHRLVSARHKGVSMLPSFRKSFAAWKAISPDLKRVAVITGPGLDLYVRSAKAAANAKGISLLHRVVNSDKELLVEYKSIADQVQGYWLWPDNRVLSGVVLRDVLTFSMRRGKQVAVFNDELLELGGLISITSDYQDIANNVLKRLRQAEGKKTIPGPVIEPLDNVNMRINALMAKRLGLTVPKQYRKYLDAQ